MPNPSQLEAINLSMYGLPFDWSRQTMFDGQELSMLELSAKVAQKVNDMITTVNDFTATIAGKEDSSNITIARKLSSQGNFTGLLGGMAVTAVLDEMNNNKDQLQFIAQQFSDGQTGFVINGGFFSDTGIHANYSGGVF